MRFLLIAALCIKTCLSFPMCTDGQTPLMEANDAFTCDRGCPLGFNCEFQDPYKTLSKAICCPNMTALQTLYGDEEHSEPIWDLSEVASLSLGLQAPSDVPPTPATIEGANAPAIRPPHKETLSKSEQLAEETNNLETTTENLVSTDISLAAEETTEASLPEIATTSADPKNEATEENEATSITDPQITTETSFEESSRVTVGSEATTTTPSETSPVALTTSLETTSTASPVETESSVTVEGSGVITKELAGGSSQKSCDRQRYRVFCHKGKIRTLATLRWSWNQDKGECEFYPWGYCPGDRIVESSTIRTKEECETVCGNKGSAANFGLVGTPAVQDSPLLNRGRDVVAKFEPDVKALPSRNSVAFFGSTESIRAKDEFSSSFTNPSSSDQLHNGNESPKAETAEDKENTEPAAATEVNSSNGKDNEGAAPQIEEKDHQAETSNLVETDSAKFPETLEITTVTSNTSENLKKLEEAGSNGDTLVDAEAVPSGSINQRRENSLNKLHRENESPKVDVLGNSQQGIETTDGIVAIPNEEKKGGVLCGATSYRFACQSGMPSQFVYRWEMVDGKCQSFPYGYCYGEFNHGHPRTTDECSLYCSTPGQLFFAI